MTSFRATSPCVLLIAVLAALPACRTAGWKDGEVVTCTGSTVVQIERWQSAKGKASTAPEVFDHPVTLNADALARTLERLKYRGGGKETRPAIHAPLVPRLAVGIADGLARADRQSRVRFSVTNPGSKVLFIPVVTVTRGVAFVSPAGRLNIAFDVVDETIEFEDEGWADPVKTVLSRGRLAAEPPARVRVEKDLWLTVALADGMTAPPGSAKAAAKLEPPKRRLTDEEIVERLRFLERLYREGTITEAQYKKIRESLLK